MTLILVVEDSEDLAFGLRNNLEFEGYEVLVAGDGKTGLELATQKQPDLIILDLTLPELDGLEVLEHLRSAGNKVPVLVLTARHEEIDKVRGLKLGADDYVTKPFGLMELLARVEALLRRTTGLEARHLIQIGEVQIDVDARTVTKSGERVDLAPRELDLLLALIEHQGKVVSRQELLTDVWGHSGQVVTRTVDTHIAELRRKLEPDPAKPRYIQTARKAGYRFELT
ncbi:MAG: response regulator transcription factor [Pseudomonadales bacterium]|nr:response regulator transcription factor [Pseudomonadales bacterium]